MTTIDPLFLPKILLDNPDEVLKFNGFEKDEEENVYDPLNPPLSLAITSKDIVAGSLKIEPYKKRRMPTKIQLVASYRRTHETIIHHNKRISTLTPATFKRSLPPLYHTLGTSNSPTQIQVLEARADLVHEHYKPIKTLRIKESTFDLTLTLRLIEREIVEETCVVE